MFFVLVGVALLAVVGPVVWWSLTRLLPRILEGLGILSRPGMADQEARLQRIDAATAPDHEARLQRIEDAIDALAVQVERVTQQQQLTRGSAPPDDR